MYGSGDLLIAKSQAMRSINRQISRFRSLGRDDRPILDLVMPDADDVVAFLEAFEYLHPTSLPHTEHHFGPSSRVIMHPIDEVLVALRNDRFFGYEQGIGMFPKREIDVGEQTRTERAADVRNPRAHTNRTA